jgi:hypothetical protein
VVDAANVSFVMVGNEYDTTDLKREEKYENIKKNVFNIIQIKV